MGGRVKDGQRGFFRSAVRLNPGPRSMIQRSLFQEIQALTITVFFTVIMMMTMMTMMTMMMMMMMMMTTTTTTMMMMMTTTTTTTMIMMTTTTTTMMMMMMMMMIDYLSSCFSCVHLTIQMHRYGHFLDFRT